MANVDRLVALSMVPELAKEVANQIETGGAQGAAVANSTATDVAGVNTVLNNLLASLRAAGIIAS